MNTHGRWRWIAIAAGAVVLLWTVALAARGAALSLTVFGLRVSSRDPFRSLVAGAILASIGLAGLRLDPPGERWCARAAAAVAALALALGLSYGTFVAGGADAYGYVSQADLWTSGAVVVRTPLASEATWRDAAWAMTPLGYRPAREAGWMAPVYPVGLPLTMAAMKTMAGERGVYFVVPLLGALLVWLTYLLGRAVHSAEAGLFAAVVLLASPAFLFQLMMPMTDVPVAAWWLGAVILALRPGPRWRLVASGVLVAIALLTRPNLVLLGAPVALLVVRGARGWKEGLGRVVLWGIPGALAAMAIAVLNAAWYGSPLESGYGGLAILYSPRYTWTNLAHFTAWMIATQTPFIFLGLAAPSRLARWCAAFAACVLVSYLWYLPFENWTYLRFLLPAFPMLLVTAAAVLIDAVRRYRWPGGSVAAAALILVCVGAWQGRLAFSVSQGESRYRDAAEFARLLPDNAVVIANLHSGSVRYYAHRVTLRYEWLGADEYEDAIRVLHAHGHPVFALLDGDEVTEFRERYQRITDLSWLNRSPLGTVGDRVFLYAVP